MTRSITTYPDLLELANGADARSTAKASPSCLDVEPGMAQVIPAAKVQKWRYVERRPECPLLAREDRGQ